MKTLSSILNSDEKKYIPHVLFIFSVMCVFVVLGNTGRYFSAIVC